MYFILSDLPALTILFFSLARSRKSYEASYPIFCKGSAVPTSFPIDIPLIWFQRPPWMHVLQHSRKIFLVLINWKFSSVFTLPLFPVNIGPLIFIHNARTFCPLVESEYSCQTANYENTYLQQGYYYPQQNYFTELLE